MIVDRRATLAGMVGGAVLGAAPARAAGAHSDAVLIIDSRRPAASVFVERNRSARVIDIAVAGETYWKQLRAFAPGRQRVHGLTRWSDWVLLRGMLLEKGLRVRAETAVASAATGDNALFLWEMA